MRTWTGITMTLVLGLGGWTLRAEDEPKGLEIGDAVPEFEAIGDDGETWKSADHVGKKIVVVYFYPADFTGGCTKQACGFRDDLEELTKQGVEVVGVSGDSAKTHALFKKHEKLNFTLLDDYEGKLARLFGVPTKPGATIEREIDGVKHSLTRGVTASRWTYVIGKDGKIAMKNTKVDAANDSKAILKLVAEQK